MSNTRIFLEQIDQSGASSNHLMVWNGTTWTAGPLPSGTVSLSSMATLTANTILGNNTGASATPLALNGTQVTAMLTSMVGATGTVAGTKGLVPTPASTDNTNFLRGDGTWVAVTASTAWGSITGTLTDQSDLNTALTGKLNLSHAGSGGTAHALVVSGGDAGFMTGSDKAKIDGISSGATANSSDAFLLDRTNHTGTESITTNTFSATSRIAGRITAGTGTAEELTGTQATTLLDTATQSLKGLLSATDKTKLDGVATGATANSPDATLLNRANHTGTQVVSTISFTNSSRFLGRATAGTGTGEELTGTQATALLDVASGTLKGLMSSSDFSKLSGIAAGATANQTDAYLLSRANHTGTQAWTTITSTPTTVGGYGITDAISTSSLGANNGVATLDGSGKLTGSQIPAIALTTVYVVASQAAQLALTAQSGDVVIRTDLTETFINNGGTAGTMADWTQVLSPTGSVSSVNGYTGTVVLVKGDIGLGNVDNTADTDKPVSSPQQTALNLKVDISSHVGLGGSVHATVVAGGAAGFMTGTDKTKLDGIASGATANQTDTYLLSRANHTGTESITTNTFAATGKIAGRITAGAGTAEELTGTQVTSILDVFGTLKGLVPGIASNTTQYLRADGSWATPPNTGVWGSITGTLSAQTDLQAALDSKAPTASPTFTGKVIVAASTTSSAGFNMPTGTAPTTPVEGDIWLDTGLVYYRTGSTNKALATSGSSATFNSVTITGSGTSLSVGSGNISASGTITGSNLSGTNTGDQTITLTGDVTGSGTGSFAATIGANTVSLAKMATLAANSIIGNNTGAAATPIALTGTQITAMLDTFGTTTKGLVPAPGTVTSTKYLRDDGTWQTVSTTGATGFNTSATGTGASQDVTLPQSVTAATDVLVFVNGLLQQPSTDYTVAGTTLTITTDNSGDGIYITRPSGMQGQGYQPTVLTQNISGAVTINSTGYDVLRLTVTGNVTSFTLNGIVDGNRMRIEFIQDAVGSHSITLSNQFAFGSDVTAYTPTQTANKRDLVGLWVSGTTIYVDSVARGY